MQVRRDAYVITIVQYVNHQAYAPTATGALETRATEIGPPCCTHLLTPDFVYERKRSTRENSVQQSMMQLCKTRLCHILVSKHCAVAEYHLQV